MKTLSISRALVSAAVRTLLKGSGSTRYLVNGFHAGDTARMERMFEQEILFQTGERGYAKTVQTMGGRKAIGYKIGGGEAILQFEPEREKPRYY